MEPFAGYGHFWLPQEPRRVVAGELKFDGDGLVLELDDALVEFQMPTDRAVGVSAPSWVQHHVLHGLFVTVEM